VTEVTFLLDDLMVCVAGRDENGVSHLLLIEANQGAVRLDHVWEGNHTILDVVYIERGLIVTDSGGTVTFIEGHNWNEMKRFSGSLPGGAVSWHIPINHRWGVGGAEGRVMISGYHPYRPEYNITVSDGPVTGFAWTFGRPSDFILALQLPDGRSRLEGWQFSPEDSATEVPDLLCTMEIEGTVVMMGNDPRGWSRFLVALEDGTLASYKLDIRPKPKFYEPGDPDDPDGRGLEPFAAWHMEGTPVINRTFDQVADIRLPGGDYELNGFRWSSTDRWLVVWGTSMRSDKSSLVLRVYDVPSFQESESFDTQMVMDATHAVQDMLFLPGDEVLAMCCAYGNNKDMVRFLDLRTGEVTSEMTLPAGPYDMSWDGDNVVVASEQGGIWTISPPYNEFNRTQVGPDYYTKDVSVNGSSGWCHLGWHFNIKVMAGMPREEVAGFETTPNRLECVAWTGVPGDFMTGSGRPNRGSSLQLWRLGDGEEGDWRSVGGARLLTELNSTRKVNQIEADPAFPGIMAVSYVDGTLALYHLNLTPYPDAPEELGGLDIDPYLPPTDDGTGNGGDDPLWGSDTDWVFPVVLITVLVLLLVVIIVLRSRTDSEDD
jgi:hypothetical protein